MNIEERITNIEEYVAKIIEVQKLYEKKLQKTNKILKKINQKLNFKCVCKFENLFSFCWMIFFTILAHVAIVKYQTTFLTIIFITLIPVFPIFFSCVNYDDYEDEKGTNDVNDCKSEDV